MADYVSKYNGSQVDSILDKAIGLPRTADAHQGDVLMYTVNTAIEWASVFPSTANVPNGNVLSYDSTNGINWNKVQPNSIDTTNAINGYCLTYISEADSVVWSPALPSTADAETNYVLALGNSGTPQWVDIQSLL